MSERETLGSRAGFILLSAGCAIGLGNVWRFPFIAGKYGGAAFIILYLIFLVFLALPIMVMEFAVGRASRQNIGNSFKVLEPKGSWWHLHGYTGIAGNYLLMMFYTTVTGWILAYTWYIATGRMAGLGTQQVGEFFEQTVGSASTQLFWMALTVVAGIVICSFGLRKGVERVSKFLMAGLFVIMVLLCAKALTLPKAGEGLAFYLWPNFSNLLQSGLWEVVFAAMGQAFFTLSIGIGSMAIFGSYMDKKRSLTGESVRIMLLDLIAALMAGFIIFPTCFSYGVNPGAGPSLIFVTLPNVFNNMAAGRIWGVLFFIFMSFAALSTVIAVFENIISYGIDVLGWTRKKSCVVNLFILLVASAPCALGFNALSSFQPLGKGTVVLDLEDFILSNNLLPLGGLVYALFCCSRYGWGWDNFIAEADTGKGMRFPRFLKPYFRYVLPCIIVIVFIWGYIDKFGK